MFTKTEYYRMELMLLDFFSWNLDLPNPVQFMEFYLVHAVTQQDSQGGRMITDCTKPKAYVRKYVHYFLEISLQGKCRFIFLFNSFFLLGKRSRYSYRTPAYPRLTQKQKYFFEYVRIIMLNTRIWGKLLYTKIH